MLGLPDDARVLLFDLDGVLTDTATVHTAAWAEMFNLFLMRRASQGLPGYNGPFTGSDYLEYVDGRPRFDGIRAFLAGREIAIDEGGPADGPDVDTVHGLGARKNALVVSLIETDGVDVYPDALTYLDRVGQAGLTAAVVSSSANCRRVLDAAGLTDRFALIVDGLVAAELGLAGKPSPEMFIHAATALGAEPGQCVVFEDALAGVKSGVAGHFGAVIGIGREGEDARAALAAAGADRVVSTLTELLEDR